MTSEEDVIYEVSCPDKMRGDNKAFPRLRNIMSLKLRKKEASLLLHYADRL